MIDRGKIVEDRVNESGKTMTFIANKLGVVPKTLRNWFDTPNLDIDKILKIGKVIGYDFSADFPDLRKQFNLFTEPDATYEQKAQQDQVIPMQNCMMMIEMKNEVIKSKDQQIELLTMLLTARETELMSLRKQA